MVHSSKPEAKEYVIIAAGGSGIRLGSDIPKQFIVVKNKPLIVHTIEAFAKYSAAVEFIIALPEAYLAFWNNNISSFVKNENITLVQGGKERFHSVKNALEKVDSQSIVAVQDAVRPFASSQLIARCFDAAGQYSSAIPVMSVNDSIRKVVANSSVMVDRSDLRTVQTPQCFNSSLLKKAYQQDYRPLFTDDAAVVEATGASVHLVEGERNNIKITTPEDLEFATWLLTEQK